MAAETNPVGAIVGAGASAIGGLIGSKKQADASKYAANLQAQAAQKALDLQKSVYDQQTANQKPYLQAGQATLGNLGQMAAGARQVPLPAAYGSYGRQGLSALGNPAPPPQAAPPPQPMGTGEDFVTVTAPTGETMQMSRAQAAQAVAKGARITGQGAATDQPPQSGGM